MFKTATSATCPGQDTKSITRCSLFDIAQGRSIFAVDNELLVQPIISQTDKQGFRKT